MTTLPPGSRTPARLAVEDGAFLPVNGLDQWVALRGADAAHPALMVIGGPGAAFSPLAPAFAPWEADFTLVHWDQPNAGATLAKNGWSQPYRLDRLARDGVAVAEQVHARLGVPLALFCTSGGTCVGLKMIRARPDLFCAYVGQGQVVVRAAQEAASYARILADARAAGDGAAAAEIEALGPPPWPDLAAEVVKSKYANAPTSAEQTVMAALSFAPPLADARYVPHGLAAIDVRAAAGAAYAAIRHELYAFDAYDLGLDYQVPIVLLQGAEDRHTTSPEVEVWAGKLRAPSVAYVPIPEGGHLSMFLFDRMAGLLREYVRPLC